MPRLIKIILTAIVALATITVAGAVVVVSTVDPNEYKDDIARAIQHEIGREVVFEGDIGFSFLPRIGLKVGPVVLRNAPGFKDADMVRVDNVEASLLLEPLLSGRLSMGMVVLDGLTVHLTTDAHGRTNWEDLAGAGKGAAARQARTVEGVAREDAGTSPDLSVQGVRITNARLVYEDMRKGTRTTFSELNLSLGRISGTEPFPFELGFNCRLDGAEPDIRPTVSGEVRLTPKAGALSLEKLNIAALGMQGGGRVTVSRLKDKVAFLGNLQLAGGSLREALLKLGVTLPETRDPHALEKFSADVAFSGTDASARLDQLTAKLDDTTLSVQGAVSDFAHPAITVAAQMDDIDLGRYLPPETEAGEVALSPSNPDVEQTVATDAQSPLSALGALNLDARLVVDRFRLDSLNGSADLRVASQGQGVAYSGGLRLATGSARQSLQEMGVELPETSDPQVLGPLTADLSFSGTEDSVGLDRLTGRLDDTTFAAQGAVSGFEQPAITLAAQVDALDVDRYLPPRAAEDPQGETDAAGDAAGKASPDEAARQPGLEVLRHLNLEARLTAGSLKFMNVKTGDVELGVTARDGLVTVSPVSLDLYGGSFAGRMTLDTNRDQPEWTGKGALKGVRARGLVSDLFGEDKLHGVITADCDLKGAGLTPATLKKTVCGQTSLSVVNGSVIGLDVGRMIRDGLGRLNGASGEEGEAGDFDFSMLSATATLENGHIVNEDLALASSLANASGAGWADLPQDAADYTALVTVVGSLDGLEGQALEAVRGIPLPVHISGKLERPDVSLDMESLTQALVNGVVQGGLGGLADTLLGADDEDDVSEDAALDEADDYETTDADNDSGDEIVDLIENLF